MAFVHLHRHSEWSLLDGTGTAVQYAERAAELGQPGIAQTDHGNLAGALHHYTACKQVGVTPILGMEAYFRPERHTKNETNKEYYHLVLLAKDIRGWHNLMRLASEAYSSGFYYKPCVDFELLEKYNEGLICSTACMSSYICKSITRGDELTVQHTIDKLKSYFGDDLFIEIMPHDFDDQRMLNIELVNLASDNGVPVVATVDAHYPYKEWAETQDIVLMMATGQSFEKRRAKKDAGEDVYKFDCESLYLMSEDEVRLAFKQWHPNLPSGIVDESIANTFEALDRVVPMLMSKRQKMPRVEGDPEKIVWDWCQDGLKRIGKDGDPLYEERLKYEFGVLKKNEVLDYFVIVGDVCHFCARENIRMGCGRGSAAGCLVSYLVGITHIDPIPHGLLFERFLNPDRKGMPDIDLDFQSDRRDEVKKYLAEKYGEDHVADICAFQTFKPRAAIQKIARVYDLHKEAKVVSDTIDEKETMELERLATLNPTLEKFSVDHPDAWTHACRVQGQTSTLSKHAGGVVITDKPIAEYMPTMNDKKGGTLTQWGARADFNIIDDYGFMKIDVLGLKGLAMQEYACDLIEKRTGERIRLNQLPVCADPHATQEKTLQAFTEGLVLGVWQFSGSPGFAKLARSFRPDWLGDLGAANAIYRPGPLGGKVHEHYTKRKFGQEKVHYYHESAEEALKETYGLIVYQEQIMELAKRMGNFTGGEADTFRKAISKEYRLGMAHVVKFLEDKGYKEQWWTGCRENGVKDAVIEEVWKNIIAFGDYGFNKSHAYAYAVQAYQDMYLKVNYPAEFYAALLTFDPALAQKVIREARTFDVAVLPPDINKSGYGFGIDNGSIRVGLKAVKNVGDAAVAELLAKQPFRSYEDLEERAIKRAVNKKVKTALLAAGAFDCWGMRKDWSFDEINEGEVENLSVRLTQAQSLTKYNDMISSRITTEDRFNQLPDSVGVTVGGEILNKREITTKGGRKMGFFEVQFGTNHWSCTMFPNEWPEFVDLIYEGSPVMIQGRKNVRDNGDESVVVDEMCGVEELALALAQENND